MGVYLEAYDENDNIHSCAFFVYDEKVFYYLAGARNPEYSKSHSQELIFWRAIQYASEHSKIFDFEGSMVEGIEWMFQQFGGECTPYYVIKKESLLNQLISDIKPRLKKILGYKI